jgi:hypothetical protein
VKKHVRIQGLKFTEADAKEVDLLQEALDRVPPHGIVQCSLKMDANTRNCCTTLLSNHAIPSRVTRLSVWTGSGYPELSFASFTNLTELCIGGEHLSEKTLLSVLSSSPALKDIALYESSLLGLSTVQALCSHARSLVHLTLLYVLCHPELLSFIGHCCCNLQELAVHSNSGLAVEPSVTEVGLLAIARGCRKLRDFRASDLPSVTEAVLLTVAAHCPEMAILTFDRCSKLTDRVLLALSAGCPKLREQIASLSLYGGCTISEATLLTLAALRPGVVEIDVELVSGEVNASTLITLIRSWPKLHSGMICRNRPITDAVLRAIAAQGTRLNTLSLSANTIVSEAAVLELAESGCLASLRSPTTFNQAAQQRVRNACAVGKKR